MKSEKSLDEVIAKVMKDYKPPYREFVHNGVVMYDWNTPGMSFICGKDLHEEILEELKNYMTNGK